MYTKTNRCTAEQETYIRKYAGKDTVTEIGRELFMSPQKVRSLQVLFGVYSPPKKGTGKVRNTGTRLMKVLEWTHGEFYNEENYLRSIEMP